MCNANDRLRRTNISILFLQTRNYGYLTRILSLSPKSQSSAWWPVEPAHISSQSRCCVNSWDSQEFKPIWCQEGLAGEKAGVIKPYVGEEVANSRKKRILRIIWGKDAQLFKRLVFIRLDWWFNTCSFNLFNIHSDRSLVYLAWNNYSGALPRWLLGG